MPSPFPGLDPYLEQCWRDIHARCIIYAADPLQTRLPADLRARVAERVWVEPAFLLPVLLLNPAKYGQAPCVSAILHACTVTEETGEKTL